MTKKLLTLGLVAVLAASTVAAEARDLRLTPGAPPVHPAHKMYEALAENLPKETDGKFTGTILGPEVVNIGGMKAALQSSVTEIGNFLPLYYSADVPNSALMGDLAFLGQNSHVMGAAMTEYVVTCGDCQAEYRKAGVVYGGSGSSDPYVLLTTKPVRTAEDLKGLRLRSGGSPFARFAEYVGASPVSMPVSETFESISQGVIDGTMASANDMLAYRLVDLVKYVTELPLGTYHATSNFTIGAKLWDGMSVEERKGVMRAANLGNPVMTEVWGVESPAKARAAGKEAGIEFIEADQSLLDVRAAFIEQDLESLSALAKKQYGIDDAAEKIARFKELVTKWEGLLEGKSGVAEVAAVVQAEVWDKVDYETYGK